VLAQCRCPHVTRYHCCELVPESSKLYIIMEYMAGGSVADLVRRNPNTHPTPSCHAFTHTHIFRQLTPSRLRRDAP
jgi:serine/threonine protein kinase